MMEFITQHNLLGLVIGLGTFLIIGLFHPIVIKAEYYCGVKCWWAFLLAAVVVGALAVCSHNVLVQSLLGVTAFSCLWSILEVFEQRERVRKGWFPANPKRKQSKDQ